MTVAGIFAERGLIGKEECCFTVFVDYRTLRCKNQRLLGSLHVTKHPKGGFSSVK